MKRRDHRKLGKELELFTLQKKLSISMATKSSFEKDWTILKKAQKKVDTKRCNTTHRKNLCNFWHYAKYGADSFQISTPAEGEEFY
jgi:threonyl-tRNA synthetase